MTVNNYNRRTVEFVSFTDTALAILPLADVKAFLRIDGTEDDALLTIMIGAAVDGAEKYLRRALRTASIKQTMDGFPWADDDALARLGSGTFQVPPSYITGSYNSFDLAYPPVNSVTSITTYSTSNAPSVFSPASYILNNGRVVLNQGFTWPTDLRKRAAVEVVYSAGYGPTNLPAAIKLGMMQHLVAMYDCRSGCDLPDAARGMMNPYRILDGLSW